MEKIDNIQVDGKWQFDATVAHVFDDMLARSIPQYEVMRRAVFDIGRRYVTPDTWVIDLGCSRGQALKPFAGHFGIDNHYLGVEVSDPMREAAIDEFRDVRNAHFKSLDLRMEYPTENASVVLAVLTLQFIPIEHRHKLVQRIYDNLPAGGALVVVEKVLGSGHELNALFTDIYYGLKGANGYSDDQIERKRLSLEGVLVPITARWNEHMLARAGFKHVDCFWRWMNFAGWVAVK